MSRSIAIAVSLFVIGLPGCGPNVLEAMRPIDFDPVRWKEWDDSESDLRFRMVPSLLRNYWLIGLTKAEVEELLGPTPYTERDAGFEYYHYQLGRQRHEWGDWGYPFLSVEFAEGRAVRVFHPEGMGAVAAHTPRQK